MWFLFWKKYALSKFATFISIIGAMTRYAGAMCLFSGLIPATLICFAIGIGLHFGAEAIAKNKASKVVSTVNGTKTVNSVPPTTKTTSEPITNTVQQASRVTTNPTQNVVQSNNLRRPCPNCGNFVLPTSKFCNECGTKIIKEKKCLRCGNILEENDKFCVQCGYKLN